MQYDQRVLCPRYAPKSTLNQITLLSLVVLVFVFVFISFLRLRLSSERTYIDKRSYDDKLARIISKTLRSCALKLERFFHGQREHSSTTFNSVIRCRQSALRHHHLAKEKEKDAFESKRIFKSHSTKAIVTCPSDFYVVIKL